MGEVRLMGGVSVGVTVGGGEVGGSAVTVGVAGGKVAGGGCVRSGVAVSTVRGVELQLASSNVSDVARRMVLFVIAHTGERYGRPHRVSY